MGIKRARGRYTSDMKTKMVRVNLVIESDEPVTPRDMEKKVIQGVMGHMKLKLTECHVNPVYKERNEYFRVYSKIKYNEKRKYNYTYEMCPKCEREVKLKNKFRVQECPKCGERILPCSICTHDKNYMKCDTCPLEGKR